MALQQALHSFQGLLEGVREGRTARIDDQDGTMTHVRHQFDAVFVVLLLEHGTDRVDATVELHQVLKFRIDGIAHESGIIMVKDRNVRLHAISVGDTRPVVGHCEAGMPKPMRTFGLDESERRGTERGALMTFVGTRDDLDHTPKFAPTVDSVKGRVRRSSHPFRNRPLEAHGSR